MINPQKLDEASTTDQIEVCLDGYSVVFLGKEAQELIQLAKYGLTMQLRTHDGYGSVDTKIRKFTTKATDTAKMKPGRELDALIAEKIMGLYREPSSKYGSPQMYSNRDPKTGLCTILGSLEHYSTDIASAWKVLEKITTAYGEIWIGRSETETTSHYECYIHFQECTFKAQAETAPHAICLAAIKLIENDEIGVGIK